MKLKLAATAALAGITMATAGFASASMLTVDGGILQYGEDTILTCDDDSLTASWVVDTSKAQDVQGVRILGINPAACQGATLAVKVQGQDFSTTIGPGMTEHVFPFVGSASSTSSIKMWIYS